MKDASVKGKIDLEFPGQMPGGILLLSSLSSAELKAEVLQ